MSHWATDTVFIAAAQFVSGIVGFFYRVFLSKHLGPEGMGVYQQTLAFYFTAITFITAGIPVSVSKLVAETRADDYCAGKTVTNALVLTAGFSVLGTIFLLASSIFLKLTVFLVVLPAAIMVGFSSVLRGYFLGTRNTGPIRWSILLESLLRAASGYVLVSHQWPLKWEQRTKGAVTALALGELVSLSVFAVAFRKTFKRLRGNPVDKRSVARIMSIAVPVSLSQIINSLSGSLEAVLLPISLGLSGLSPSEALAIYGKTSGMALPLLFFPALFTMSLSSNIIPHISRTVSSKNPQAAFILSQKALTLSSLFSFAVAAFFIALGEPVGDLLYKGFELEGILRGFAAGIPFFYTGSTLRAILRGAGNNKTPLLNSALGSMITIILLWVLCPRLGIYGYAVALITADAVATWISISELERVFSRRFDISKIWLKPLISCGFMVLIQNNTYAALVDLALGNVLSVAISALMGICGYLLLAFALGMDLGEFMPH